MEQYLGNSTTLSKNTLKSYTQSYNKLMKSNLFTRNIETTAESVIIENIKKITDNPNTAASLLNVCIIIKKHSGKNFEELFYYRNKLKTAIEKHHKEINDNLNLPTYGELTAYLDTLYKNNEHLKYVINYLLINYGVRNKDLDIIIVRDKKHITNDDNYFVVLKTRVIWVRNVYKTAGKYGSKSITIKNIKFMKSLNALQRGDNAPLLINASGGRIADGTIGYFIQNLTLDRIGEGNIAKIIMKHNEGNYNKLTELSNHRGTNVETLISRYNINTSQVL